MGHCIAVQRALLQVCWAGTDHTCRSSVCSLLLSHACDFGRAWRRITAGRDVADVAVACIGSTTAIAAEKQGFQRVYFPDQPGIEGFVSAITDALSNARTTRATTNVA